MSKSTATVTVMSALPAAHVFPLPKGRSLTIQGRPESLFVGENGLPLQGNQYGETPNVSQEDWDYIMRPEIYGEMAFFKSKVVFASTNEDKNAKKKELKDVRSGLEQLDPVKDARTTPVDKEEA